jgi:cytidine deaminase
MAPHSTGTVTKPLAAGTIKKLIREACAACVTAYAPYSKLKVGAAVLTDSGAIHRGCNIENASYGATVCAERVALWRAVADGARKIRAVAVVYHAHELAIPCGMCRQVLSEFGPDMLVIQATTRGKYTLTSLATLLPAPFVTLPANRAAGVV